MAATAAAIIAVVVLYFSQANFIAGRRPLVGGAANFPAQFLGPHNAARATVGLRPLVWDARLAGYAAMYASSRRRDCALVHSDGPYGENIFWGGGTGWTAAEAVAAWVAERRWYRHADNTCARGEECGHYTQIIWADTRRMGCAAVTCVAERGVFITCNYDPPGNFIGEKPY